jgi:hypothetical protein
VVPESSITIFQTAMVFFDTLNGSGTYHLQRFMHVIFTLLAASLLAGCVHSAAPPSVTVASIPVENNDFITEANLVYRIATCVDENPAGRAAAQVNTREAKRHCEEFRPPFENTSINKSQL